MKSSFVWIAILFLFGNCKQVDSSFEINDARLATENLLNAIKLHEYNKMNIFYSEDFFAKITGEKWQDDLEEMDQKFGSIDSYQLIATEVTIEDSIFWVTLKYEVKRKSYTTEETFIIARSKNSTRITAHHIKI